MATLPEGRVILCGHSMGGLLTAEVAFAAPPNRVIGLMSFDVPFLGVHPHVIIRFVTRNKPELGLILRFDILSGIASLFKKKEGRDEAELNDPQHVEIVTKQAGRPYLQGTSIHLTSIYSNLPSRDRNEQQPQHYQREPCSILEFRIPHAPRRRPIPDTHFREHISTSTSTTSIPRYQSPDFQHPTSSIAPPQFPSSARARDLTQTRTSV